MWVRNVYVLATLLVECVQDDGKKQACIFMRHVHAGTIRRAQICERVGGGQFEPYVLWNVTVKVLHYYVQ